MESKKENKQKINWKRKGLGWVPDYPDLRDYGLDQKIQEKLRFKTDESTRMFELFAQTLIETSELKTQNENQIREVLKQILGEVKFTRVKVHKLLRESASELRKQTKNDLIPLQLQYKSILSKQLSQLKKSFLALLLIKDNPFFKKVENITQKDGSHLINFNNPTEVLDWLSKENYDLVTKELVKVFQEYTEIKVDGVVGLETYTTFNEYFYESKKILRLFHETQSATTQAQSPMGNNSANREDNISKIKLISISSLLPKQAWAKIIDILKLKATEQIYKEYRRCDTDDLSILFEESFLKELKTKNPQFFNKLNLNFFKSVVNTFRAKRLSKNGNSFESQEDVNEFLDGLQKDIFSSNSDNNSLNFELFSEKSYIIEPILSVILKIISPLAQWKPNSVEEVVEKGFIEFESLIIHNNVKSDLNDKNDLKILSFEFGYYYENLAKSAIHKFLQGIIREIKEIKNPEKNSQKSQIFLLFLFKKLFNNYQEKNNDLVKSVEICEINHCQIPKPNIFDKQEVFEIEYKSNENENESNERGFRNSGDTLEKPKSQKDKVDLFPTFNLQIPVTNHKFLERLKNIKNQKPFFSLPNIIDLSFWFSPVRDQGSLNSCTAFAAISLLEYFVNRGSNRYVDASPLFLYKVARNKMKVTGDRGASIRETMKAMALFGVPPEDSWSYDETMVDEEPPPYCYSFAQNYKTLKFFLLDYAGITTESLLFQIKAVLSAGFPCIFGFTLYTSAYEDSNPERGYIPFPDSKRDKVVGGHTVVAVGYDDFKFIRCADRKYYSKGAFLIRNSWGTEWGEQGYGWLPYDYVLGDLTAAWWSLLKAEWFNEDNFGASAWGGENSNEYTGQ